MLGLQGLHVIGVIGLRRSGLYAFVFFDFRVERFRRS